MKIALLCSKINQNDQIFTKVDETAVTYQGGHLELKKILLSKGIEYQTIDRFKNFKEIDIAIVDFALTVAFHELLQLIKSNSKVKILYYMHEPETAAPLNNKKILNFLGLFDAILSLRDDLIDNERFFKILPAQREFSPHFAQYKATKKNGICLINTFVKRPRFQKLFNNMDELYSERIKVIRFFKNDSNFHLYGKRWGKYEDQEVLKNSYKGFVENKIETMSKYKFSICFESQVENGYVSEKIFDSLLAFCVPIYKGAKNITKIVPKNCFINFDDFESIDSLKSYLDNLTENDFQEILNNIETYLKSDLYAKNSSKEFASKIQKHIESKVPIKKKYFYFIKIKMLILSIFQPKRVYNKKQRRFLYDTLFFW